MPKDDAEPDQAGKVTLMAGSQDEDYGAVEAALKTAEDIVHSLPNAPEVVELTGLLTRALSLVGTLSRCD